MICIQHGHEFWAVKSYISRVLPDLSVDIQICDIPSNNIQERMVKILPVTKDLFRLRIWIVHEKALFLFMVNDIMMRFCWQLPQLHHRHRWPQRAHRTSGQLYPPKGSLVAILVVKGKEWGRLTMPVRVVPCPCKALKWDISMWIEILGTNFTK